MYKSHDYTIDCFADRVSICQQKSMSWSAARSFLNIPEK